MLVLSNEVEIVDVRTICPICKKPIHLKIPKQKLRKSEGGILSIPYEHGEPPHLVILYVDIHGDVRGISSYDIIIREKEAIGGKVSILHILEVIGLDLVAIVFFWVITEKKIRVKTEDKKLEATVKILITKIFEGKVVDESGEDVIELDLVKPMKPAISLEPIKSIFNKLKDIEIPEAQILWIRKELLRYKRGLKELIDIINEKKIVSKKDLLERLGSYLSYHEILILIEALRFLGYEVDKIFNIKEVRIRSLFG